MAKYEAMLIFNNTIDDAALETKLEELRSEVAKFDGKVDSFTRMGRRSFARPLGKKDAGTYVLAHLTLKPDATKPLCGRLTGPQKDASLLRLQLTRAPKPFRRSTPKTAETEQAAPAN